MIKAVFFDLDGTLLASGIDEQIRAYLMRLTQYFAQCAPELAKTVAMAITQSVSGIMLDREPEKTICDKFWARFCAQTGAVRDTAEPLFEQFYSTVYNEVGAGFAPVPEIVEAVALCKKRGLRMLVATNCFYPRVAIEQRLQWAGLCPDDFEEITHYGNMHFTKPHLEYFREAAALIGVDATECAMVGNNGAEDMVAGQLGMKTFLLTDFLLDENGYKGDRGSYNELLRWLEAL